MNSPTAAVKNDVVRSLEDAAHLIGQPLAQAQATLAARGVTPSARLPEMGCAQPQYRVFRHGGLGLHFVLRDIAELPGHTCVFGPLNAAGEEVTFGDAVAFANRAFTACTQQLLSAQGPTDALKSSASELAREAERLVALYAPAPTVGAP